jgi:hypothetical protein
MPAFPLIDEACPSLLDVLIGLEDYGCIPVRFLGEPNIRILSMAGVALPYWLVRGVERHRVTLVDRLQHVHPDDCVGLKLEIHLNIEPLDT